MIDIGSTIAVRYVTCTHGVAKTLGQDNILEAISDLRSQPLKKIDEYRLMTTRVQGNYSCCSWHISANTSRTIKPLLFYCRSRWEAKCYITAVEIASARTLALYCAWDDETHPPRGKGKHWRTGTVKCFPLLFLMTGLAWEEPGRPHHMRINWASPQRKIACAWLGPPRRSIVAGLTMAGDVRLGESLAGGVSARLLSGNVHDDSQRRERWEGIQLHIIDV